MFTSFFGYIKHLMRNFLRCVLSGHNVPERVNRNNLQNLHASKDMKKENLVRNSYGWNINNAIYASTDLKGLNKIKTLNLNMFGKE